MREVDFELISQAFLEISAECLDEKDTDLIHEAAGLVESDPSSQKVQSAKRLLEEKLETSWISEQSGFEDLSLQAKFRLFTKNLTSVDSISKMKPSMVTDLDLSQVILSFIL